MSKKITPLNKIAMNLEICLTTNKYADQLHITSNSYHAVLENMKMWH